ncbi:hypothetical protein GEV33_004274 [Tenebrio molitor]|uniref:Uncharacterized protein n=1 Tax=Tenebrio molitor TaxID=7067 RepID=A0A8J6HQG7_TENMO|nr:hypothetical protein GEV33_004274 [Tenebrio molitor]
MQGNMQYVFHDVSQIQIITYFYGRWCTVLEILGPWCLPDKKLVVPREKLELQRLKMLFFSPLMTTKKVTDIDEAVYVNLLDLIINRLRMSLPEKLPICSILCINYEGTLEEVAKRICSHLCDLNSLVPDAEACEDDDEDVAEDCATHSRRSTPPRDDIQVPVARSKFTMTFRDVQDTV